MLSFFLLFLCQFLLRERIREDCQKISNTKSDPQAFIFILIGCVLTAISYRPREFGEDLERFLSRQEWGGHLKVIGPVILVIGVLMMILGITFCILGYKVTKSEEKRFYADSISSATVSKCSNSLKTSRAIPRAKLKAKNLGITSGCKTFREKPPGKNLQGKTSRVKPPREILHGQNH